MFLQNAILKRMDDKNPVKVALIGAGKFGSMFLSQVPSTSGLEVSVIADLKPENAIKACKNVGWSDDLIKKTKFVDQGVEAIKLDEVDVVVESTGFPAAGIEHARQAFQHGKHIVMVNVEAHQLALRSEILNSMSEFSEQDVQGKAGRVLLAAALRDSINGKLMLLEGFGGIEEVHFTSFVLQ